MADIEDVTLAIASALQEARLSGMLNVKMDGEEAAHLLGSLTRELEVVVIIKRASDSA